MTAIIKEIYTVARRDKCPHCEEEQEDVKIDKPVSIVEGNYKLTASEVRERLEKIPEEESSTSWNKSKRLQNQNGWF